MSIIASGLRSLANDLPSTLSKVGRSLPRDIRFTTKILHDNAMTRSIYTIAHGADEVADFSALGSSKYGYVMGTLNKAAQNTHLEFVSVPEAMAGKGIGTELLTRMGEESAAMGSKTLTGDIINVKALTNRYKAFGAEATTLMESPYAGQTVSTNITNPSLIRNRVRRNVEASRASRLPMMQRKPSSGRMGGVPTKSRTQSLAHNRKPF